MIVQTVGVDGKTDLDFTIPTADWEICKKLWKNSKVKLKILITMKNL